MFFLIEFLIYFAYLYMDISGIFPNVSSLLKFLSIALCFYHIDKNNYSIKYIMFLTVISDFFLVLTDMYHIGVFCFIFVQLGYYCHITSFFSFSYTARHLSLVLLCSIIAGFIANLFIMHIGLLEFFAITYFFMLIYNIFLLSINLHTGILLQIKLNHQEAFVFLICLILILCCDIHVAVTNIFSSGIWFNFGQIAMWLFYLPSQVIISLLYGTKSQYSRILF